jgi:signal transduction histidine kinase
MTDARLQRERALREVTQALAEHLDEGRVLDLTVQHATSLLLAPFARVWLVDGEAGFRCAAARGFVHAQTMLRHLPLDSVSGIAARGEVLNLLDAPTHEAWRVSRDFGERTGMRAFLGAPIRRAGESLGVLEVMREGERPFQADDERLLQTLADIVAVAVSNARQAASLRVAQQRLSMLAEASALLATSFDYLSTLRQVCALAVPTLADVCSISLVTESATLREVAASPVEAIGATPSASADLAEVMRVGAAVLAEDGCSIAAPLVARGRTLGVLRLTQSTLDRTYAQQDLALATDLARRCATAVDNARLYKQAEDALQVRDQFLAVAAHELRSPLTRLKSHTEVLVELAAEDQTDPAQMIQSLHRMNVAIDRLSALTSDLLDVSRLRGRFPIRRQAVDLNALIRSVAAEHQQQSPQHRLVVATPEDPCVLRVDPDRLGQVVSNLLDNAIKYSPEGGPVYVSLSVAESGALLNVRDEGIGLPQGAAERVFEPFTRAANAFAGTISGLGLGLHVCKQIVQRHGGRMWAESPGEMRGTTVTVWLPLRGETTRRRKVS